MPLVMFEDDPELKKGMLFCQEALRRGVFLHQNHTMFLSVAHTAGDIDQALDATDAALDAVAKRFGAA